MNTNVQDFIQSHQFLNEVFKPVKDFEGRFWISNHGNIVSHDHRKNTISFLSPYFDSLGYYNVQLRMKPKVRKCRVHQLVGEHFCDMPTSGERMGWNHIDGDKRNNLYSNLEYISLRENVKHAVSSGLFNTKGVNHHNSKLTEEKVLQIRSLYKTGLTQKKIGEIFGICRRQAGDIINRKNWGWLT